MKRFRATRLTVAVLVVTVGILAIGAVAIASNTGFKLNKGLVYAGTGQVGRNWTSVPFFNPYGTVGGLCTQTGLTSSGAGSTRATMTVLNETAGSFATVTCGTSGAASTSLIPGKGIQIVQPSNGGTGPTSLIIVGSHNPALSLTVPAAGTGQVGRFWFAVPYHTTAVNANDLCLQAGLTVTGAGSARGAVTRLNASTGGFDTRTCGTSSAASLALTLGEHYQLVQPLSSRTFVPAHF